MQQFDFDEWKAIITLATRWSMERILDSAVLALRARVDLSSTKTSHRCGLTTVELLALAATHPDLFHEKSIFKLFSLLVSSSKSIPVKEAGILDGTTVALIAAAREVKNEPKQVDKQFRAFLRFIEDPDSEWWNPPAPAAPAQ